MSLRTGKGSLSIRPSAARLRTIGRRGNDAQRRTAAERRQYGDTVPF
jgi:hypothetical protein